MHIETCAERKRQAIAAEPAGEYDPKSGSSKFRGVYKRRFDTKWRAEITAGACPSCAAAVIMTCLTQNAVTASLILSAAYSFRHMAIELHVFFMASLLQSSLKLCFADEPSLFGLTRTCTLTHMCCAHLQSMLAQCLRLYGGLFKEGLGCSAVL